MAKKMATMVWEDWLSANPKAVPKNGAEQGVARSVAKSPDTKWAGKVSWYPYVVAKWPTQRGVLISKTPQRFSAKRRTTIMRNVTNTGFLNYFATAGTATALSGITKINGIVSKTVRLVAIKTILKPRAILPTN